MKIAIFDLDGVIIDSRLCNYRAFAAGIEALGLPAPEEEVVVRLIGHPALVMLERLGCPSERSAAIYDEVVKPFYLENLAQLARPVEGASETLQELRRRGYHIGACTSGDRALQTLALEGIGLLSLFEAVQTPDDSAYRKPHPEYLGEVVRQLGGTSPSQVWHMEDSEVGLQMGLEYGATTVFADYGFGGPGAHTPHHRISSIKELLDLL